MALLRYLGMHGSEHHGLDSPRVSRQRRPRCKRPVAPLSKRRAGPRAAAAQPHLGCLQASCPQHARSYGSAWGHVAGGSDDVVCVVGLPPQVVSFVLDAQARLFPALHVADVRGRDTGMPAVLLEAQ